jgi:multidrug efflux pump subunit AcrA (membrane-fusion protein)
MPRTPRRFLTPLNVALGALAAGGVIAAVIVVGPESSATATRERTVTVTKGVVQSTVSGSGNLSPANTMDLSFGATGKVTKVYVKAGQHVTSGQLLARIDPTAAEVDLAEAQATLSSAQDALDAIESGTATTTSTASTASTASVATANVASVKATAAQATTAAPASTTAPATTTAPAKTAVPKTTTTPATPSTGSSGSGGGSGSTMSEASAVAAVKSAQLAVDNAQDALTETALRAPTAATVAAVNGAVGDQVSAGSASTSSGAGSGSGSGSGSAGTGTGTSSSSAFITLTQLSRMHLEVSLSESDINSVKVGQQATVTVNAASGEQVAGKVTDIGVLSSSASSTGTSSAVSYPVTIALNQTTKGLRAGMSATAEIVTGQASGVVVPTQALQGSNVTVVKGGKRTTQRVTAGVAGDSTTQIVSGLIAGQQVIVTSASAAAGATGSSGTSGLANRAGRTGLTGGALGGSGFAGGAGPPAGFAGGGGR